MPIPMARARPAPSVCAFDYVTDQNNWLYIVRGTFLSGETLLKAIRPPGSRVKCITDIPIGIGAPHLSPFHYGGRLEYVAVHGDLVQRYPRHARALESEDHQIARHLAAVISEAGLRGYVFGSRRLGLHQSGSDWDVLVVGPCRPSAVHSMVAKSLGPTAHAAGSKEIEARARRYGRPRGALSPMLLDRVFRKTTMYVYCEDLEIGLFFAFDDDEPMPPAAVLAAASTESVTGEILACGGDSHRMPRKISLRDRSGIVHRIQSTLWEIGGLEEWEGSRVRLHGARMLGPDQWWLGGPDVGLEFLR